MVQPKLKEKINLFVSIFVLFTALVLNTGYAYAGLRDPFFDLLHDTNTKVSLTRQYFYLDKEIISDEELKAFYRKNPDWLDAQLERIELGKRYDCWAKGTCSNLNIGEDILKKYWGTLSSPLIPELIKLLGESSYLYLGPLYNFSGSIQALSKFKDYYQAGADAINSFGIRYIINTLYPAYEIERLKGVDPLNKIFGSGGLYDDLKNNEAYYVIEQWKLTKGWDEGKVKNTIYDYLELLYLYRDNPNIRPVSARMEIGTSILKLAEVQGILKPLTVLLVSSIVEQNQSVIINGSNFSNNANVEYIYTQGSLTKSGLVKSTPGGDISITIQTDCFTVIGQYEVNFIDTETLKTASAAYTVVSALLCDKASPSLLSVSPPNGTQNVSVSLNSICFGFSEPMNTTQNIAWSGVPSSVNIANGVWNTSSNICFDIFGTLPYSTTIGWVLNNSITSSSFTDLAGNQLPTTSGLFVTEPPTPPPLLSWTKTFGGPQFDHGYSVEKTKDGGYIITGDKGWSTPSVGAGTYVYLIKTDEAGNTLWEKTFQRAWNDSGQSVQQTSDGGYIVAGNTIVGAGGTALWIIKTDSSGNLTWESVLGGYAGKVIRQTSDGGYIILGSDYNPYVRLFKIDQNGALIWHKISSPNVVGSSLELTSDGGYIVAGETLTSDRQIYLLKADANGDVIWEKTFGEAFMDYGRSAQQTSDGGYIITGKEFSTIRNGYYLFLVKVDADGNLLWEKTYGDADAREIRQVTDGGYIVAGSTVNSGAGGRDCYLMKTDVNGTFLWEKTYGGSGNDECVSVQKTDDGGYIAVGYTESFGAGYSDVYLIKTDGNGNVGQ